MAERFQWLKTHIEISLLLLFFAFFLSDSIKSNLLIYRTCYVTLGYSKAECSLLGSKNPDNQTANLEKLAEPYAAVIGMMSSLTESLSSAAVCLFVGPWSDRFGRKPLLVVPLIGYLMYYLATALFCLMESLSPWYSVLCFVPVCFTGGFSSFLTAACCYITDLTSEKNRGMRMGFFEVSLAMGTFCGTLSSSYLFAATGYVTVFLCGAFCCLLALLYTIFFLPESLTTREEQGHLKEIFKMSHINDMLKVIFKTRDNYDRFTTLACVVMTIISIVIVNGHGATVSLFLREKFHWSLQRLTLFSAAQSVVLIVATLSGVYFLHKKLKIPETVLILVSQICSLNGALMMAFAQTNFIVYIAPFAKCLESIFGPMSRSLISKVIPRQELGKVFSLLSSSQFLFGTIGSPLYTLIYNSSILTNPGDFYFVTAGFCFLQIVTILAIIIVRSKPRDPVLYASLVEENEVG